VLAADGYFCDEDKEESYSIGTPRAKVEDKVYIVEVVHWGSLGDMHRVQDPKA
jgi:hypothetical protein